MWSTGDGGRAGGGGTEQVVCNKAENATRGLDSEGKKMKIYSQPISLTLEVTRVLRKACWCWWLGQWEEFG